MNPDQDRDPGPKPDPSPALSSARRRVAMFGALLAMSLSALEATVVATAMPTVVAALGGLDHFSWVFSVYQLGLTVTMPLWGRLSDLHGRRAMFQISITLFLVGSAASGAATSMPALIAFRAVQGLGAGALMPLALTTIGDLYPPAERPRVQALFSSIWGVASIVGPALGGAITEWFSWRWVFYLNIPLGLLAMLLVSLALPERARTSRPRIDLAGAAVLTTAITLLMLALSSAFRGPALVPGLGGAPAAFVIVALLVGFVAIERRASEPIVPLGLLGRPILPTASISAFFGGVALLATLAFAPLLAQATLGATASEAGSMLTPLMLSWVLFNLVGGRLILAIGYRPTAVCGFVLVGAGLGGVCATVLWFSRPWLVASLALVGAGLGLALLTLLLAVQHSARREELGLSTSLMLFLRSIGGAAGVALLGGALTAGLTDSLGEAARAGRVPGLTIARAQELAANPDALVRPELRAALPVPLLEILRQSFAQAMRHVFGLAALAAILGLIVALRLPVRISTPTERPPP